MTQELLIQLGLGGGALFVLRDLGRRMVDSTAAALQEIAASCRENSATLGRIEGKLETASTRAATAPIGAGAR